MEEYKVGDVVTFVDVDGNPHNALVTYVWQTCLNVAYVSEDEKDASGHKILTATSVPFKGSTRFYVTGPKFYVTGLSKEKVEV